MAELTATDQVKAARNEGYGEFTLTNPDTLESKTFELKHLSYDAYIEFCTLAHPIISAIGTGLAVNNTKTGELSFDFDPTNLDFKELLKMAGDQLPRMAYLCCKQSDPKVTVADVKRLGYRPQVLLNVVLEQVRHNRMVQEFADFFPQVVAKLQALVPDAQVALQPLPMNPEAETPETIST